MDNITSIKKASRNRSHFLLSLFTHSFINIPKGFQLYHILFVSTFVFILLLLLFKTNNSTETLYSGSEKKTIKVYVNFYSTANIKKIKNVENV